MSSFFTAPASQRKRKRADGSAPAPKKRTASAAKPRPKTTDRPTRKPREREDSISGSDASDSDDDAPRQPVIDDESEGTSEEEGETADERRLRLAQRYLDNIREEVDEAGFDAADVDRDLIAERLKEDVAGTKGKLHRFIADDFVLPPESQTYFSADQRVVVAVATCAPYAFTASKDGTLVKWELPTPTDPNTPHPKNLTPRRRPKFITSYRANPSRAGDASYQGHTGSILCLAASSSGKFLASGGSDKRLVIWDAATLRPTKAFLQHRDSVLGVSFRRDTHMLFSASADRTIKIWSLDELAYVETLFGHQDHVIDVAGQASERCISVGARDRTARLWKVVEESQLVFRGGSGGKGDRGRASYAEGSIDRVALVDEDTFVTGSDNGTISLWSVHRKKPVFTVPVAHGMDTQLKPEEVSAEKDPDPQVPGRRQPRWVTALATVPLADVVLSGSWDGVVKVWRVTPDRRRIEAVGVLGRGEDEANANLEMQDTETNGAGKDDEVPQKAVRGVINDISVFERGEKGKDGLCVVVGTGKEMRLGQWKRFKEGKNGAVVFEVKRKEVEGLANGHGEK
ncbi:WD40 repeat-like protein [Trichodelitschia bisporula]|uniref:WD40 repeat-like protein n=1 Tax=Trichodelitschia bisporula TaxID=703511 RepID=A0A6G1IBI3_9PEZI|nr:WD40 repeat-like protein [Trichodelitschia bisporula]